MTYWEDNPPPMSFIPEGWTWAEKRAFRYRTIPYLPEVAGFDHWRDKSVLCIGDGAGIDAVEYARHGALVHVIDMSEQAVDLTMQHAREAGVRIAAYRENACSTHFEPAWFDCVYSFGVFHHIPEVGTALDEVRRVLKPNGSFAGMVYNRDSLLYAYSILRRAEREGISADEAMRLYSERNPNCPHSVAYTAKEWSSLLEAHGLAPVAITPEYNVIDLPDRRKVPVGGPPELGWHLFFTAVKK